MEQMTKEQAIKFGENKCYEGMTDRQIAELQLSQECLCVPFGVFMDALGKCLGRSVYTHELAKPDNLLKELCGEKEPPTFKEIIDMLPAEKRILFVVQKDPK